ncbi:MAG: VWA domain-containing protein [Steroidobacteraceae bacterium]|nr:VWA domain-containing protein [Steroidobacteraceae bacterium]
MFELLFKYSPWAWRAGELSFASSWPLWLLPTLAIAGAAIIAASLLRRRHLRVRRRAALGALQAAMLAIILFMLWRPVLLVERVKDRENVVAVVLDASASMAHGEGEHSRLQESVRALDSGALDAFRKSFGVRLFSFANEVHSLQSLAEVPPPGTQTRIGDALHAVMQTGATTPLSGIVVITDGGENGGTLSEERLAELASFGVPVHTVGVGPEKNRNDLELDSVALAEDATPGEVLNAEVTIRHDGKGKTRLRVYDGERLLAASEVELSSDAGITTHTIPIRAGESGVRDLHFTLDPLEGERNTINNTRTHVLDVMPRRRNILYIEGEPRWEYKFIRRAAETDSSLRLASLVRATPNRYYRQGISSAEELAKGFPQTAEELFAYDAVIIGSFEAAALNAEQHQALKDFVDRRGGGLLMLAGRDGLADGGWGRAPVAQTFPAALPDTTSKTFAHLAARPRLTIYGAESPITRLNDDPKKNVAAWNELPPLADLQPLGRLKPGAIVLVEATSGSSRTAQPLLVWQHYGRGATYLLGTASTWRWKMRLPHQDQRHHTFWRQLLHALASDAPARTSLTTTQKVYDDEKKVVVNAELRNERYEPINDASVELTLIADDGATSRQTMVPSGQGDGRYTATVQADGPGLYRLSMKALRGQTEVASAQTHIRRNNGIVEHFGTQQNRALLQRIADATGGRYWRLDQLDELPEALRYSKAGVVERQTLDLWNLPALFLLLLALKGAEWLLRLRWKTL